MPSVSIRPFALRSAAALVALSLVAGCTTIDPRTGEQRRDNTRTGILAGAAAGALLGYLTNTNKGEEGRTNAMIGAGIGALAGGAVGRYMDQQQAALERELAGSGVDVERRGDDIYLTMPAGLTFAVDSDAVAPQFYAVLDDVSRTLNNYPQTYVDVIGHASSDGAEDYNQRLSERRASNVAAYLINRGVMRDRMYVAGMGERQPIADNATQAGREQNRRVEIIIQPHVQGQLYGDAPSATGRG